MILYKKFVWESPLSVQQALEHLKGQMNPRPDFWDFFIDTPHAFHGFIEGRSFTIHRSVKDTSRNGFQLSFNVISGTIESSATGSRITVKMRPGLMFTFYSTAWLLLSLVFHYRGHSTKQSAIMVGFWTVVVIGGFSRETAEARRLLYQIFRVGSRKTRTRERGNQKKKRRG